MENFEFDKCFFEKEFSEARMKPYFERYKGNDRMAIELYENNIRISESLLPSISVFEVAVRNAIISELERMTGNKEWYEFFRLHPELKIPYAYIEKSIRHISARGELVTADKINGELTMGFWVSLFNAEYERVLWKPLRRAFPFLPKRERQRKSISTPLNMIRSLRNRVFHHEAICWNLHRLCLLHETIIRTVGWLNPMLPLWLKRIDRFDCVVRENHNQH